MGVLLNLCLDGCALFELVGLFHQGRPEAARQSAAQRRRACAAARAASGGRGQSCASGCGLCASVICSLLRHELRNELRPLWLAPLCKSALHLQRPCALWLCSLLLIFFFFFIYIYIYIEREREREREREKKKKKKKGGGGNAMMLRRVLAPLGDQHGEWTLGWVMSDDMA